MKDELRKCENDLSKQTPAPVIPKPDTNQASEPSTLDTTTDIPDTGNLKPDNSLPKPNDSSASKT